MGGKNELTVDRATKLLLPLSERPPTQSEKEVLYDTLARLPPGVSMDLVTKVLDHDAKAKKERTDVARSLRAEYAPAVASLLRKYPSEAASLFRLAALPASPAKWGSARALPRGLRERSEDDDRRARADREA